MLKAFIYLFNYLLIWFIFLFKKYSVPCLICNNLLRSQLSDLFSPLLPSLLQSAMENGLWGYTLFLASKMESRSHNMVLSRFVALQKMIDTATARGTSTRAFQHQPLPINNCHSQTCFQIAQIPESSAHVMVSCQIH